MRVTYHQREDLQPARPIRAPTTLEQQVPSETDLEQEGFDTAAGVRGDLHALRLALRRVAEDTASIDSDRKQSVTRRLQDAADDVDRLTDELNRERQANRSSVLAIEAHVNNLRTAIATHLKDEITTMQAHPDGGRTIFHPLRFWFLAGILAALTVYLLAFYPSIVYSAVFANLGEELENAVRSASGVRDLFTAILNPRALSEAARNPSVLVWVLLFTALPLGIGVVTHSTLDSEWRPTRKALALTGLLAFALVLDGAIAYRIAQRIHEAGYLTGGVDMPWARLTFLEDVNFWLVILVGFGAYVVWGLVLLFFLEQDRNRHPERQAIRDRTDHSQRIWSEIWRLEAEGHALEGDWKRREIEFKQALDDRIAMRERARRELGTRIVDWSELETRLDVFTRGWIRYLVHSREATASPAAAANILDATRSEVQAAYTLVGCEAQP